MTDLQTKMLLKAVNKLTDSVDELKSMLKPADRLIDVKEICQILNMKQTAVYERINRGEIPAYKVNGKMQMSFNKLQEMLPDIR